MLVYCFRNDSTHFVIPDLIEPAPYLIRGNPGFPVKTGTQFYMFLVPCLRRDRVWIPAAVYPVLDTGRE